MREKKKILLTVTTDLNYDQRMIRICTSLAEAGYQVELVGIEFPHSHPLSPRPYEQTRLRSKRVQGKMMYLVYWYKLLRYLIRSDADMFTAIDLDTILPVYFASIFRKKKRAYDAHEIFTEMQEVNERKSIKYLWSKIANFCIPEFPAGYTIGEAYAEYFQQQYGVHYSVVRNATVYDPNFIKPACTEKIILYQGAVNKGRGFEYLIPAMQYVSAPLWIIGKGNFSKQVEGLIEKYQLEEKVKMLGYIVPEKLREYTAQAYIGITLFDDTNNGLSNTLSMANRFFDYMHHGVPQLCCNFPEYRKVNERWHIAQLIDTLSPEQIAEALNLLLDNEALHSSMSEQARLAAKTLCWQEEAASLLAFYKGVLDE